MMTIYKYELEIIDHQEIEMPAYAQILKVAFDGALTVWCLVNTGKAKSLRHFRIFGTGQPCNGKHDEYIDTVFDSRGLVWHVFDAGQEL